MAQIPIPFVDQSVDTENPSEGAATLGLTTVGVTFFMGIVAVASYLFNKAQNATGVSDEETQIPGV